MVGADGDNLRLLLKNFYEIEVSCGCRLVSHRLTIAGRSQLCTTLLSNGRDTRVGKAVARISQAIAS